MTYFLVFSIPFMAWTSRMCGGGRPKLPYGLDQWLYALPYLVFLFPIIGWWAVFAYIVAVAGKRAPTAPWLDLGHSNKWRSNSLSWMIDWMRGRVSEEAYDASGLALGGFVATAAPSLALAISGHFWAAAAVIISGVLKPLAYMIGWAIFPDGEDKSGRWPKDMKEATAIGELLAGAFCGVGLFLSVFLI